MLHILSTTSSFDKSLILNSPKDVLSRVADFERELLDLSNHSGLSYAELKHVNFSICHLSVRKFQ